MKSFLTLALFACAISFSTPTYGDEFEVPKDYELNSIEAYADLEDEIILACDWLINNNITTNISKEKEVNTFYLKWIIGSPNVNVNVREEFVPTDKKMSQAAIIFMAGWTKYALETRDFKNESAGVIAGIEALITHYKINKDSIGEIEKIEDFIKLKEDGKLKDFVYDILEDL